MLILKPNNENPKTMLHSKHSDAFFAVIDTGSFELAAERLCITPSAVTLRVQALEKSLGHILVIRERPCRTTQSGQQLLSYLQQSKLLEQNLLQDLSGKSAESEFYTLNIATNADSLATWLLSTIRTVLIEEKIALQLKVADQTQTHRLLEAGLVSACISTQSKSIKGCDVKALGETTYRLVATADFIERWFKTGVHREALRAAPAVIFNEQDQMHHDIISKHFGLNMTQYPHHLIPASSSFLEAITLGLGFGMVPEFQIHHSLKSGELIDIVPVAKTDVKLYWHHWKMQSLPLQKLTEHIIQYASLNLNHAK